MYLGRLSLVIGAFVALPAQADAIVAVTISPQGGVMDEMITWSAMPLEGSAVEAIAMPESQSGDWQTEMAPGQWLVEGYGESDYFSGLIEVSAEGPNSFDLPAIGDAGGMSTPIYTCLDAPTCAYEDAEAGLSFVLPQYWSADKPYFADLGDGVQAPFPTITFYQESEEAADGEGGQSIWLNAPDWTAENGPCQTTPMGALCVVENTDITAAAAAVIIPSLRLK